MVYIHINLVETREKTLSIFLVFTKKNGGKDKTLKISSLNDKKSTTLYSDIFSI